MQNLPLYIYLVFGITVLATIWLFAKAAGYSKTVFGLLAFWIILQSVLGIAGFYNDPATMTNRFPLLIVPVMLFLLAQFFARKGKLFIDGLDTGTLTILHIIRIPVEMVLFWLFVHASIPQAMTFEGRNFDIFSGITAPFVYYFGFVKKSISKNVIILWNVLCILLLLNVVVNAILSLPARAANFGFDQANIALGNFPFILLPTLLVPLVLFSNLAAIRQLLKK